MVTQFYNKKWKLKHYGKNPFFKTLFVETFFRKMKMDILKMSNSKNFVRLSPKLFIIMILRKLFNYCISKIFYNHIEYSIPHN